MGILSKKSNKKIGHRIIALSVNMCFFVWKKYFFIKPYKNFVCNYYTGVFTYEPSNEYSYYTT